MFEHFPPSAQVWIYSLGNTVSDEAAQKISSSLHSFLQEWHSHKVPVEGAFELVENRFIVASASAVISGCSIDSLGSAVREAAAASGIELATNSTVYFVIEGEIKGIPRSEFGEWVHRGEITPDTVVFDLSVSTLEQYQTGFKKRFCESWHARAFPLPTTV